MSFKDIKYTRINPAKSLENIIQFFWDFSGEFSSSSVYNHSISASINPKLAFQYKTGMKTTKDGRDEALFNSGFQCQTSSFYQVSASQEIGVFGVSLQPCAIPLLFNIPAGALTNLNIEISALLGEEGKVLEEQILNSTTTADRIKTITNYFQLKLREPDYRTRHVLAAVRHIVSRRGSVNIQQLADANFLSQRQFERRFNELTGFSPKTFSRIIRFEGSIVRAYRTPASLTQLSLESGYYDQSHMIRDFKEFTGKNPKEFLAEAYSIFVD